jgi:hypothetical protein
MAPGLHPTAIALRVFPSECGEASTVLMHLQGVPFWEPRFRRAAAKFFEPMFCPVTFEFWIFYFRFRANSMIPEI